MARKNIFPLIVCAYCHRIQQGTLMYRNKIGSFVQNKISWLGNIGLQIHKIEYVTKTTHFGLFRNIYAGYNM